MKSTWIENYAGRWRDDEGRTLIITIRDEETASVTLLLQGTAMARPWYGGKPARGLPAKYSPAEGPDLEIDLGRPGFSLSINYEYPDPMHPDGESLSIGISRYESDAEADRFIGLFGKLGRYKRSDAEPIFSQRPVSDPRTSSR